MKKSLYVALIFLIGCGKPSETTLVEDTTQVYDTSEETTLSDEEQKWAEQLERFLADFDVAKNAYPSIGYSEKTEVGHYRVDYYFEDDNLVWMATEMSEEGGIAENYFVHREPEGTSYLYYGTNMDGGFGFVGMDESNWYVVKTDGMYKPYIASAGHGEKFDWEGEFEETMHVVRQNRNEFSLAGAIYEYQHKQGMALRDYEFSEVLYESNLLSPTPFNPEMIAGYLNWWYPLYEEDGKFKRHKLCNGDEAYIKISVAAGNYRWDEEGTGPTIGYLIKGFEESEGDAFYATIERNGNRLKKTLVIPEFEEGGKDKLYIDGRVYTSEPENYEVVEMKCE